MNNLLILRMRWKIGRYAPDPEIITKFSLKLATILVPACELSEGIGETKTKSC